MSSYLNRSTILRLNFATFLLIAFIAPINAWASLIGHWTFDEGSGLIAEDSSGNGRTGTLLAAPGGSAPIWINDGISDNALSFNGTGYVDFANTATDFNFGASGFTIAAWARYNTIVTEDNFIVGKHNGGFQNGYFLSAWPPDTVAFYNNTGPHMIAATAYNDNQWHFVVGTNDGATGRLYVDGQYIDSRSGTPLANTVDLLVGGVFLYNGSFVSGWVGSIDDVRVYNNALTQAEISQLYTSTVVSEPATVWLFSSTLAGLIGFAKRKQGRMGRAAMARR